VPALSDDVEIQLAQHTSELRALAEGHRAIRDTLDRFGEDIHQLTNTVTILASRPAFSAGELLDNIIKVGAIAGLAVAGILYVNQAFVATDLEKMRASIAQVQEKQDQSAKRIERLENVLIYKGGGLPVPAVSP
jgi:hypothetical protein